MTDNVKAKKSKKFMQIVGTSEKLLKRHGVRLVTVEEICREAEVSKMTFYKYFPNKIELIKYLFSSWFEVGFKEYDEKNALSLPITGKLRRMIELKITFMSDMSPELVEEFIHAAPELKNFLQQSKQKSYARFLKYITGWQENCEIKADIKPELIIAGLEKIMDLFGVENLQRLYRTNAEILMELHKLFFYGLLARPETGK